MWLSRLDLLAYGRFTDVQLPLGPGFHLVYGPNEAGKSTTLRAIRQLLFGVDERTSDNFVHSNPSLRIGGIVCDAAGNELHVIRRKARKDSLRAAADETAIDVELWQKILMGIDESAFSQRYGIDYEQLTKGGHEIATGSGDLGEILFATGSGIRDLAAIEKKLADEAAELFKAQGKKQRLNQAIAECQLQREQVTEKLLSVTVWEEADRQRQNARSRLEELSSQWSSLMREIDRYRRWQQAKSLVEEIKKIESQLAQLTSVSRLPEQFDARRQHAQYHLKQSEIEAKAATESLKKIQKELARITVAEAILERTDDLNKLFADESITRKALLDRAPLVEQLMLHEKALIALRQTQDEQAGIGELPVDSLDRSLRTRMNQLGRQQAGLAQSLQQAETRQTRLQEQVKEVRQQLATKPAAKPQEELKDVVRQIRSEGDLEARLNSVHSEIDELEAGLLQQLLELTPWSGSIDELKSISFPKPAEIQKWESKLESQRSQIALLRAQMVQLDTERESLQRNITELQQQFQIPQASDLQLAREHRDALWSEIQKQIQAKELPADSLTSEFEQSFAETDRLADRLRNEADRVAQLADQLTDLKSNEIRTQELSDQVAKLESAKRDAEQKWHAEWPDFKTAPLSPREMLTWLAKREVLLQNEVQLTRRHVEAATLFERVETLVSKLTQQLVDEDFHSENVLTAPSKSRRSRETSKSLTRADGTRRAPATLSESAISRQQLSLFAGHDSGPRDSSPEMGNGKHAVSLSELLASAEKRLEQDENQHRVRQQAEETLARLLEDEALTQEQIREARSELSTWQAEWQKAMQRLNLNPELSPDVAMASVETLFEIVDQRKQADQLRKRIDDINAEAEQFYANVKFLCQTIAPDLFDLSADESVSSLRTRLSNSLRDQIKFNELTSQKKLSEQKITEALQSSSDAIKNVVELCQMAGVGLPEFDPEKPIEANDLTSIFSELAQAVEQSKLRTDCESRLEKTRQQLSELADPEPIESFMDQVHHQASETIAQRLQELNQQSEQLAAERDRVNQQLGGFDEQLKQMDGSAEAAEAEEKHQLLLAQIRSDAEHYVRIKLASSVLKSAIERYREKIRGPVLSIASELFRELTLSSFDGLQIDEDEQNKPILVGLRAGNRAAVPVTGMSEGTCDQLYLALRLASLQLESQPRNRLPFIVDDILIQFDDARATAALRVLSRFGRQRQVIYFTHHEHLLDIARQELSADCSIHRLDGC